MEIGMTHSISNVTLLPCTECNYNFKFFDFFYFNVITSFKLQESKKKYFVSCSCRNAKIIVYKNNLDFYYKCIFSTRLNMG